MTAQIPKDPLSLPMGATYLPGQGGVAFRCWAPRAGSVSVAGNFTDGKPATAIPLNNLNGYWVGFVPGMKADDEYKFLVEGCLPGQAQLKRDPYARDLTIDPPHPWSNCIISDPASYPWSGSFKTPAYNDLIVYQLHVGTYTGPDRDKRPAKFLDVIGRLDHLHNLGVNAILLLPIVEFMSPRSEGYEGVDIFSPEQDYCVHADEVPNYLPLVNGIRSRFGLPDVSPDFLAHKPNQLKMLVELSHKLGMAVLFDVVYNHIGCNVPGPDGVESIWNLEQCPMQYNHDSYMFSDQDHAGPCWDIDWKEPSRQYLIDNACFFLDEYKIDGLRYDEVSAIRSTNPAAGWKFCQDLTSTVKYHHPTAVQIAENWSPGPDHWVVGQDWGHAGFDICYHDGLRGAIREAVRSSAYGMESQVDVGRILDNMWPPFFQDNWRVLQHIENHDIVHYKEGDRIPQLAAPGQTRSWWARSRSRVANGLLLTAPGVPMLFMGQEFLEDKRWDDNASYHPGNLIWWDGIDKGQDSAMVDFLNYMRSLIWLRRLQPALRGNGYQRVHLNPDGRVLAFHRWVEGEGNDLVVVASLNDHTMWSYELGWPGGGHWREIFNSEAYDDYQADGNQGGIDAWGEARDAMPATARIVLPANSILVFAR